MAAESSSSRSSSASADSYIGSLISLTSKSEIRYEGILYNIDTEESSIGLRNVRSFGTEGRKKDGPQVIPSDKIYEYILFRGRDIKDLQMKSSPPPPLQTTPSLNSDPAIIQSHYPRPASTAAILPATAVGSLPDLNSHTAQLGQHGPATQGGFPSYQSGGNLESWGPSPPTPIANDGLAMPMYWQGYYGPPNGLPSLQQQSMLRPPPGLPMPPIQQSMPCPGFNASLPPGMSSLPGSNLPEYPSPLVPNSATSLNLSTSLPALTNSSSLTLVPPLALPSDAAPNPASGNTPSNSVAILSTPLPSLQISTISSLDASLVVPSSSSKLSVVSAPVLPYQTISQPTAPADVGTLNPIQTEAPTPSLVTPGQLLQSGSATVSAPQSSPVVRKDVEVVEISRMLSTEPQAPVPKEAQPPILQLPPTHATRPNGGPPQGQYNFRVRGRGRGRGVWSSHPVTRFTEDFDFTAMNEKFNKDEVWGHLGKSYMSFLKDERLDATEEGDSQEEDDTEMSKLANNSVYNKDDFFDSLSCNTLNNEVNGRRFSEQMKRDTETFGEYARYRGSCAGWGPGRGGRTRGSYYGRGYGYVGRGRGRSMSAHAS